MLSLRPVITVISLIHSVLKLGVAVRGAFDVVQGAKGKGKGKEEKRPHFGLIGPYIKHSRNNTNDPEARGEV